MQIFKTLNVVLPVVFLCQVGPTGPTQVQAAAVYSANGTDAAAIQAQVDAFRADLGALNPNVAGSLGSGRREIDWDSVPDGLAAPNNLPANFFNDASPRGVLLSTPGTGLQVSANAGVAPIEFGNIDSSYKDAFKPFSVQRLFTPIGSNIVDVSFFIPGSTTPAVTDGFGVVFSDVDFDNVTSIEYFDTASASLGIYFATGTPGNQTFAFLGVSFASRVVSRVRITNGDQILATGNRLTDLVVMDDFIFGEPITVPEPTTSHLLAVGLIGLLGVAGRRRRARYTRLGTLDRTTPA